MSLSVSQLRKISELAPLNPANPCAVNQYTPRVCNGILYTMGGHIDNGTDQNYNSEKRFADRIWRAAPQQMLPGQGGNYWGKPVETINKSFFPWMGDSAWLGNHLESFIGSAASPAPVKIADDHYLMAFCATVNDPNCACGEHPHVQNQYGWCDVPYSFFAMYFAVSNDNEHWRLVPPMPWRIPAAVDHSWLALDNAALWYFPEPYDRVTQAKIDAGEATGPVRECKGITGVSMLLDDDGYFKLLLGLWSSGGEKNVLARAKFDPNWRQNNNVGTDFNFEVYDHFENNDWEPCVQGRLPQFVNENMWPLETEAGAQSKSIALSPKLSTKYILCADMGGGKLGVSLTNDLTKPADFFVPDGAPSGIFDPSYDENGGPNIKFGMKDQQCVAAGAYDGVYIAQVDVTP